MGKGPIEELILRRGQRVVFKGNSSGYELVVLDTGNGKCKLRPTTGLGEPVYLREVAGKDTLYLTPDA